MLIITQHNVGLTGGCCVTCLSYYSVFSQQPFYLAHMIFYCLLMPGSYVLCAQDDDDFSNIHDGKVSQPFTSDPVDVINDSEPRCSNAGVWVYISLKF